MNKIPLETISEDTEIRFRDCFSVRYIQAAALFCRLAYAIEKEHGAKKSVAPEPVLMHEAFVLNSILSAVAFLEATVNELYSDAADGDSLSPDDGCEALYRTIAEGWRNEKNFDRAPVLARYQNILAIAGRQPFSESDPAFANVKNLIEIRNFLLHYRREWVVVAGKAKTSARDDTRGAAFETLLKHSFKENPFAPKGSPFFPERCLGHGFSEWAVLNSLIMTGEFFSRLGIPAPYDGVKNELSTR
jgi:hypothetical protein